MREILLNPFQLLLKNKYFSWASFQHIDGTSFVLLWPHFKSWIFVSVLNCVLFVFNSVFCLNFSSKKKFPQHFIQHRIVVCVCVCVLSVCEYWRGGKNYYFVFLFRVHVPLIRHCSGAPDSLFSLPIQFKMVLLFSTVEED